MYNRRNVRLSALSNRCAQPFRGHSLVSRSESCRHLLKALTLWRTGEPAFPGIVRAVGSPVGCRSFEGRFLPREFRLGSPDLFHLLVATLAHGDRFTGYEECLPDRRAMLDGYPVSTLQHVAEFAFVSVPVSLDPNNEHRSKRPLNRIKDRRIHGVPTRLRLKVPRAPQRYRPCRCPEILRNDKASHHVQGDLPRRRLHDRRECNLFSELADPSYRKVQRHGEDRFPLLPLRVHIVHKSVSSLPCVFHMK